MDKVTFKEIVELFLTRTIYDVKYNPNNKTTRDVPNINFIFGYDALKVFYDVFNDPFTKEGFYTPDIEKEDLWFALQNNNKGLQIRVNDANRFFTALTNITNNLVWLNDYYGDHREGRPIAINLMKYIWLRMGVSDIDNVELFLERQEQFTRNEVLDVRFPNLNSWGHGKKIGSFAGYDVSMRTAVNANFCETTRKMCFIIKNNKEEYDLPAILYDIDDNNNCYIYAVQNEEGLKSKTIQRKLYKLNKDKENLNVPPSKVYALLLFIEYLKEHNIENVIVPSMQVLSYEYHELLSKKARKDYINGERILKKYPNDTRCQYNLEKCKEWYDHVYNKQDYISHLKTDELFSLIYRVMEHDSDIEILNDINIQGDSLLIKVKK